jgi:hypothetical protein
VLLLYDNRYQAAAWMLPILALGIWPRLLCATIDSSLIALGKMQYSGSYKARTNFLVESLAPRGSQLKNCRNHNDYGYTRRWAICFG